MEMLHGKKLIDSIRSSLVDVFDNNTLQVDKFLQQRQQEVLLGHVQCNAKHSGNDPTSGRDHRGGIPISKATLSSHEILNNSVGFLGKMKLLLLLQQCRTVIDLLVDVHGYQIFHKGTLLFLLQRKNKNIPLPNNHCCCSFIKVFGMAIRISVC